MNFIKGLMILFAIFISLTAYPSNQKQTTAKSKQQMTNGVWKFELSPSQITCPAFTYYLDLKNKKKYTVTVLNEYTASDLTLLREQDFKISGIHKIDNKNAYSFSAYLLAHKLIVDLKGLNDYKNCTGDVTISKTRMVNAQWLFKFIPDMQYTGICQGETLKVISNLNTIKSKKRSSRKNINGIVISGEIDEIFASASLSGINIKMRGIISYAWGSAKGNFRSPSCSGRFEATMLDASKSKELLSLKNSSPQWRI